MAKKTFMARSVPASKVAALITALEQPPAATDIKKTENSDGTFDVEATVVVEEEEEPEPEIAPDSPG